MKLLPSWYPFPNDYIQDDRPALADEIEDVLEALESRQGDIIEGLENLEELVRGRGKYDWWSWTDLGLFNLLRNNYSKESLWEIVVIFAGVLS